MELIVTDPTTTGPTTEQNADAIKLARERMTAGDPIEFNQLLSVLDHKGLTTDDRRVIAKIYGRDAREVATSVRRYIKNEQLIGDLGSVPRDEYDFVDILLKKWNTRMTFQGVFTIRTPYNLGEGMIVTQDDLSLLSRKDRIKVEMADPKSMTLKHMLAEIVFQNCKMELPFNERELTNAVEKWIKRTRDDISSDVVQSVAWESPVLTELMEPEWDRLVRAITDHEHAETKAVLKHFVWQVKRKMFDLPVTYHMMPVLFGPQESGKSTLIRDYFCNPIRDFFASTDFSTITDNRSHDIWDNYVLFFDEMGRSAVTHLEDIKRKITEDTFNSRILGKNADTLVRNRATFVGTTNKSISRLIFDETGMRRFYQINCRAVMDWSVTNDIKYAALWRSVDETSTSPLIADREILQRVKHIQNESRQITMMEKWLRERPHQNFLQERIAAQALFEEYVAFEKANSGSGVSTMTNTKFGRDIRDTIMNIPGLELEKRRTMTGHEYCITYTQNVDNDH